LKVQSSLIRAVNFDMSLLLMPMLPSSKTLAFHTIFMPSIVNILDSHMFKLPQNLRVFVQMYQKIEEGRNQKKEQS